MTDAPERIFAKSQRGFEGVAGTWLDDSDGPDMVEYTLTDLTPAMLAAAEQRGREAEREACAKVADGYHQEALAWAKTVRGLSKHIDETDSSRIAAAIRARANLPDVAKEGL